MQKSSRGNAWRDTEEKPFHVGIVLLPGFSLMAYAATIEPLRSANLMRGRELYRWTHLSPDGGAVSSSGQLPIATAAPTAAHATEMNFVILIGGLGCERYRHRALTTFLRQVARNGRLLGAVSTASFILARAGLLQGHRCTLHWDYRPAFIEAFPELDVTGDLFVIDSNLCTCAGGVAALDMMLQLIREQHDPALAALVSDQFIHGSLRDARDRQRMDLQYRLGAAPQPVVKAVALMETHIETPLSIPMIATRLRLSGRQLERLFRDSFDLTPARYYLNMRLEAARKLLQLSSLPVLDIGLATGFLSASHFAKTYRLHYRQSPSATREAGDRSGNFPLYLRRLPELTKP